MKGEPVGYLTGIREFWGLPLAVSPAVLLPRPETETVVELALARLPPEHEARVLDLGTGSGAIALAIAHERPHAHVLATDTSMAALDVARDNARWLGLANVEFLPVRLVCMRPGHLARRAVRLVRQQPAVCRAWRPSPGRGRSSLRARHRR